MSKLRMKGFFKSKSRLHRSTTDLAEWTKNDDKLMRAVEKEDVKKVATLLSKKSLIPTKLGHQGSSVFHVACAVGNVQIVELLLKEAISVNDLTIQGNSALLLASAKGHSTTVSLLLKGEAEVDLRDCNEMTALHHACAGLHLACVKVLLDGQANPHITDKGGKTPLYYGVHRGGIEICRCLIEKGADVNCKDLYSTTPLMIAAKEGHKHVCEFLLRRGADPSLKDKDGHTATDYALSSGHHYLQEVFTNAPAFLASRSSITPSDSGSQISSDLGVRQPESNPIVPDLTPHIDASVNDQSLASDDEASQADVQSIHSMDDALMSKPHNPSPTKSISRTEHALSELKTEHDQLNKDFNNISIENLRLRDKIESLQMKLNERQSQEIATLPLHIQEEIKALKSELDEEKQKNKNEEQTHLEIDSSSEHSSSVSKQMETDSGASSTISDWVEHGDKNIERMQTLQSQNASFKTENEKYKLDNERLRDELTQLKDDISQRDNAKSAELVQLQATKVEKEKEVEGLKKQLQTLEVKLASQSENQKLDQLIATSQGFEEEVEFDEEGFVEGQDMTKEEFLQGQNHQLKNQCSLLTKELEKLRSQFYAILEAGDQLQADYDQQAVDKDSLHDRLELAVKEKAEIVSENEFLLSDNNALHEDLKKLVHELEKIQEKLQRSQAENEELKRSVNVASKVGGVARLLEERDSLQQKYDDLEITHKNMQTDHSFLMEEVQTLTESCGQLTAERDRLAGEREASGSASQQLESLQQDFAQLEEDFGELVREKELLEEELAKHLGTRSGDGNDKQSTSLVPNGDVKIPDGLQLDEVLELKEARISVNETTTNNNHNNCHDLEKETAGGDINKPLDSLANSDGRGSRESIRKKDEEIVRLKKKVTHLISELSAFEQKHEETVTTYRTHLLSAVQGHMDPDVKEALYHIIELRSMEQFC